MLRLLLLHPMPGAVEQLAADHAGADLLRAFESARRLVVPQSLLPPMKIDGTSIVRPANSCNSPSNVPDVRERYQFSPP